MLKKGPFPSKTRTKLHEPWRVRFWGPMYQKSWGTPCLHAAQVMIKKVNKKLETIWKPWPFKSLICTAFVAWGKRKFGRVNGAQFSLVHVSRTRAEICQHMICNLSLLSWQNMYLCFWGKTAFYRPDKDKLKWSCTTPNNKKIIQNQNQNTSMAILFFFKHSK